MRTGMILGGDWQSDVAAMIPSLEEVQVLHEAMRIHEREGGLTVGGRLFTTLDLLRREMTEAARDDGAPPTAIFRRLWRYVARSAA